MLIKPKSWERHGLKSWIEAAKKRLHPNVLAIALANKLARIAWGVLDHTSGSVTDIEWPTTDFRFEPESRHRAR